MIGVIDTETNWKNEVMSIGIVLADEDYKPIDGRYYILIPEVYYTGMYSSSLYIRNINYIECTRKEAMRDMKMWLEQNNVHHLYAYNALFDYSHCKELNHLEWFDILKVAAYKQYNPFITDYHDCCKTGRLRRNYGVEAIYRMCSKKPYKETHNAFYDSLDELKIMQMLQLPLNEYEHTKIK